MFQYIKHIGMYKVTNIHMLILNVSVRTKLLLNELLAGSGVHKLQATKFCLVVPHIFGIITAVFSLHTGMSYQITCAEQKEPDTRNKSEVQRSPQNCGSSLWNLFHVTFWHLKFGSGTLIF
jgi:hypothetical protein